MLEFWRDVKTLFFSFCHCWDWHVLSKSNVNATSTFICIIYDQYAAVKQCGKAQSISWCHASAPHKVSLPSALHQIISTVSETQFCETLRLYFSQALRFLIKHVSNPTEIGQLILFKLSMWINAWVRWGRGGKTKERYETFSERRQYVSLLLYKSNDRNFSSLLEHHWTLVIGELKEKAWVPDTLQNEKSMKKLVIVLLPWQKRSKRWFLHVIPLFPRSDFGIRQSFLKHIVELPLFMPWDKTRPLAGIKERYIF